MRRRKVGGVGIPLGDALGKSEDGERRRALRFVVGNHEYSLFSDERVQHGDCHALSCVCVFIDDGVEGLVTFRRDLVAQA